MVQTKVEELFFFQTGVPSLLCHGGRWSLVCLQIGGSHPGRTWCWSQLFKYFKFLSDARIIWITSRCQYLFLFHATPNPASQASSSKNTQKQWFLLLLGPCISDISLHPGRRRKRESAPQAFLRGGTGSYVLCPGFYWGVFLQVSPQILEYGTWPTNPKRQGEVPEGVAGQKARPCEICPVPSSYHLEL